MSDPATRPFPMIHAPTAAARHKVLDVIYAQGWRLSGMPRSQVNEFVTDDRAHQYPMIAQHGEVFYFVKERVNRTMVNSPSHLISYCKTLGDRAPKTYA